MRTRVRIEVWQVNDDGDFGDFCLRTEFEVESYSHDEQARPTGEVGDDDEMKLEHREMFSATGRWER